MVFLVALALAAFAPDVHARWTEESVPVSLPDGARVELRMRIPEGAAGERFPALLVFGGFQEASKVLDLIEPPRPVVLASFDYPFEGERRFRFPSGLKLLPQVKRTIHNTREGIPLAARELARHRKVDPSRITLIGASLGAPFALVGASESEWVKGLVLIHGFGLVPETIEAQFRKAWLRPGSPIPRFAAGPLAWLLSRAGWGYLNEPAPEEMATSLRPEQHVFVVDAAEDSFIPSSAQDAQWAAVKASPAASKQRLVLPGGHLQPGSETLIRSIMARVVEWMDQSGLLTLYPKPKN